MHLLSTVAKKEKTNHCIEGVGNIIVGCPQTNRVRINIRGSNNRVEFGSSFRTKKLKIDIEDDNAQLFIGDDCRITGSIRIRAGGRVVIGSKTTFQDASLLAHEGRSILIGEDCMISHGVIFRTTDGHSVIHVSTGERRNPARDIVLGEHVWVGMQSIIAPGAEIARGCIVAMGAIVTRKFTEPNCSLGGVPARILSRDVSWIREII